MTYLIFLLIFLGIASIPLIVISFVFHFIPARARWIKPVKITIFVLLSLLPLYMAGLLFGVLPFIAGDSRAPKAYEIYYTFFSANPGVPASEVVLPQKLIGGGYSWIPEGIDYWVRFQSKEPYGGEPGCDPEELARMSKWFLRRANSAQDQEKLEDYENLSCGYIVDFQIEDDGLFGLPPAPRNCSEIWELYHHPSQFTYARFRCHVM